MKVHFMLRKDAGRVAFPLMVWWGPADYGYYRTFKVLVLCFSFVWEWPMKRVPPTYESLGRHLRAKGTDDGSKI